MPEWRNWYTHQTQNLARFTPHESSSLSSGTKVCEVRKLLSCRKQKGRAPFPDVRPFLVFDCRLLNARVDRIGWAAGRCVGITDSLPCWRDAVRGNLMGRVARHHTVTATIREID